MTDVLVAGTGSVLVRAAHVLAEDPDGGRVAFWQSSPAASLSATDSTDGFDVVVTDDAGAWLSAGVAIVTRDWSVSGGNGVVSIGGASEVGLALALGAGLDDVELMAVARPGDPAGSETVVFPSPIDTRPGEIISVDGHRVVVADGPGPLAACMAWGRDRHRMVLDDHGYLAAICLASAVALHPHANATTAVWAHADLYLRRVVELGLVLGERPA